MKKSNSFATCEDGKALLEVLESSASKGQIELIYTRRPDAYESYSRDGDEARVFISRVDGKITGTCAELVREVYMGGKPKRAGYVCGFKKDKSHKGNVGFGTELVRNLCRDDVDFFFCSVVADNVEAKKKFEKKRHIFSMTPFGRYKTYIINPLVKIKIEKHNFSFRRATKSDEEQLICFLQREGKKKDLFPVFRDFESFYNLHVEDFYILSDGKEILATGALWDRTDCKQYIVKRYGKIMRFARIFNPLLSFLGYIKLPKENEIFQFPTLSFLLCKDDAKEYFDCFLCEIKREISKSYEMFVIGLPKNHFASPMLDKIPHFGFETELYEIKFPWCEREYANINGEKIFPECALL